MIMTVIFVSLSSKIPLHTITIDRRNEGGLEYLMTFGIISAVSMMIAVLWYVKASLVEMYHFLSTCCLH
jgi:hypothetical protein